MRKVVIVEDEGLVRRGIVQAVDWASVGFEVAGEAENGEQARRHCPRAGGHPPLRSRSGYNRYPNAAHGRP